MKLSSSKKRLSQRGSGIKVGPISPIHTVIKGSRVRTTIKSGRIVKRSIDVKSAAEIIMNKHDRTFRELSKK